MPEPPRLPQGETDSLARSALSPFGLCIAAVAPRPGPFPLWQAHGPLLRANPHKDVPLLRANPPRDQSPHWFGRSAHPLYI